MRQTTTAENFNFNKSYYENFIDNRVSMMLAGARVKRAIIENYKVTTHTINLSGQGHPAGTEEFEGVELAPYIKEFYNNDSPDCLLEKVVKQLKRSYDDVEDEAKRVGRRSEKEISRVASKVGC